VRSPYLNQVAVKGGVRGGWVVRRGPGRCRTLLYRLLLYVAETVAMYDGESITRGEPRLSRGAPDATKKQCFFVTANVGWAYVCCRVRP